MGRYHWHKKRWHIGNRNFDNYLILKVVLIILFLFFAYQYYVKNVVNIVFTTVIMLPLIDKVVESYIYLIIVAIICFGIWKLLDMFY